MTGDRATEHQQRTAFVALCTLRLVELQGPISATAAMEAMAGLRLLFEEPGPRVALFHDLEGQGFLQSTTERPPRYTVTPSGISEALSLARDLWPPLRDRLLGLRRDVEVLFGPLVDAGGSEAGPDALAGPQR